MKLYELMLECLNTEYINTGRKSSYALKRKCDTLYIFFEHSNGNADWIKNLNFPAKPYRRMKQATWYAHRGFLAAWRDVEKAITPHIMDKRINKIITVGYSHGAAIALLCHEYLWFNRPELRENLIGVGFGCPRVIWGIPTAEFLHRFDRFTVVRNMDDIVTHLPPAFLGYIHVGKLLGVGSRGKYTRIKAHYPENILTELKKHDNTARKTADGNLHISFGMKHNI